MSIEVEIFGIKVGCDSPEHAAAFAASCSVLKKPTAKHVLEMSKGPITVTVDKARIECPSVESAAATVVSLGAVRPTEEEKTDTQKAQAAGQKKSWRHPEMLAKEFDIHKSEARSLMRKKALQLEVKNKKKPTRQETYDLVKEELQRKAK